MTDVRFQQYLARFQNARLNRPRLVPGAAASAAALPFGTFLGQHLAHAAPRRRIDAMTLVIADKLKDEWITLDPGWIYEINSQAAMILNYAPLYLLPDSSKPTEFEPLLAAEMPLVLEDGLEVTIPLRPGVKFHSGNEMTADDLIFSWNRLNNIKFQASFLALDY